MDGVRVQRIVLDVLKPMEPSILELSRNINAVDGVDKVSVDLLEIDKKVENVKISIEGPNLEYDSINTIIENMGATIHSIDNVSTLKDVSQEAG